MLIARLVDAFAGSQYGTVAGRFPNYKVDFSDPGINKSLAIRILARRRLVSKAWH